MARARWTGKHLWNILNLPIKELRVIYPDYSTGGLKSKKSYWNKKLTEGKIVMPPKPEGYETSPVVPTEGRLVKTWEVARGTQNDEWDVVTLHAYDHSSGM